MTNQALRMRLFLAITGSVLMVGTAHANWFAAELRQPLRLTSGQVYLTEKGITSSRAPGACQLSVWDTSPATEMDREVDRVNASRVIRALQAGRKEPRLLPSRNRSTLAKGVTVLPGSIVRSGGISEPVMDQELFSYTDDESARYSMQVSCNGLSVSQAKRILSRYFKITQPENGVELDRGVRVADSSGSSAGASTSSRRLQASKASAPSSTVSSGASSSGRSRSAK